MHPFGVPVSRVPERVPDRVVHGREPLVHGMPLDPDVFGDPHPDRPRLFSRCSNPTRCRHGTACASDHISSATAPPCPWTITRMISRVVDYMRGIRRHDEKRGAIRGLASRVGRWARALRRVERGLRGSRRAGLASAHADDSAPSATVAAPTTRSSSSCSVARSSADSAENSSSSTRPSREYVSASSSAPLAGQRDDVAAAVRGIAAPLHQAALLELVEEADDVARIQAQRRAKPVLRHRAPLAQQPQRDQVPRAQASGQAGVGGAAADAGEVIDQRQDLLSRHHRRLRHGARVPSTTDSLRITNDLC